VLDDERYFLVSHLQSVTVTDPVTLVAPNGHFCGGCSPSQKKSARHGSQLFPSTGRYFPAGQTQAVMAADREGLVAPSGQSIGAPLPVQ